MATIINNPGQSPTPNNDSSAAGIIIGIVLVLVIIGAAIVLWPKIRGANTVVVPAANPPSDTNIKVNVPNPNPNQSQNPNPTNPTSGGGSQTSGQGTQNGAANPPTSGQ